MRCNIGTTDRLIRLLLAEVLPGFAFFTGPGAVWPRIAGAAGLVALATAAFRFRPLDRLPGITGCRGQT